MVSESSYLDVVRSKRDIGWTGQDADGIGRFMQTLAYSLSQRWRCYYLLQAQSMIIDKDNGELSITRALYASAYQGRAAYCDWRVLWVVADYFAC